MRGTLPFSLVIISQYSRAKLFYYGKFMLKWGWGGGGGGFLVFSLLISIVRQIFFFCFTTNFIKLLRTDAF